MNKAVVTLTRKLAATPERVYAAWTQSDQIERWFGPPGYTVTAVKFDPRVDGEYELRMQPPGDNEPARSIVGRFTEVSAPSRLAFTWGWVDETGALPDDGESLVTIEFVAKGAATELRLTHEKLGSEEARAAHEAGWTGSLEKLAAYLS